MKKDIEKILILAMYNDADTVSELRARLQACAAITWELLGDPATSLPLAVLGQGDSRREIHG